MKQNISSIALAMSRSIWINFLDAHYHVTRGGKWCFSISISSML